MFLGYCLLRVELLTVDQRRRLQEYRDLPRAGPCSAFDLDQNPKHRPFLVSDITKTCSDGFLPTFISHGTLWSELHKRPLTSLECLVAHGICAYPVSNGLGEWEHPLVDFTKLWMCKTVSAEKIKEMAGHGWHLGVAGALGRAWAV